MPACGEKNGKINLRVENIMMDWGIIRTFATGNLNQFKLYSILFLMKPFKDFLTTQIGEKKLFKSSDSFVRVDEVS